MLVYSRTVPVMSIYWPVEYNVMISITPNMGITCTFLHSILLLVNNILQSHFILIFFRWNLLWALLQFSIPWPRRSCSGLWNQRRGRLLDRQKLLGRNVGREWVHQDGKKLRQHVWSCLHGELSSRLEEL